MSSSSGQPPPALPAPATAHGSAAHAAAATAEATGEAERLALATTAEAAEAAARAQLENTFDYANDGHEDDVGSAEEDGGDAVTDLVSSTGVPLGGGAGGGGGGGADGMGTSDEVPELGPGEGFMLKDLNTGKMIHIVNDIDSFFDDINFTTFEQIREAAENAAKNLHGPTEKLLPPEKIPESEPSDKEADEFLHFLPRGSTFTAQIRAHAFAMDHNRKIYAVYFVDVKLTGDEPVEPQPQQQRLSPASGTGPGSGGGGARPSDGSDDSAGGNGADAAGAADGGAAGSEHDAQPPPRAWTVFRRYNHFCALQEKLKKLG
jgi:hypothetical protein